MTVGVGVAVSGGFVSALVLVPVVPRRRTRWRPGWWLRGRTSGRRPSDRCILADENGEVRDGDAILYLWATCLHRSGRLHPPRIVATSMSNLGLEAMAFRLLLRYSGTEPLARIMIEAPSRI
jgi:hypothetical protein